MFITSGGFHVGKKEIPEWSGTIVSSQGTKRHELVHNHEESDSQIWLHVFGTTCKNIHIYSIDRDIGMIGLPLELLEKEVVVQFRARLGDEKFLHLCALQSAILKDSDLARLLGKDINVTKCLQVLYICSGCDFVSSFAHLGKGIFFKVFFQYASFISGNLTSASPGHLSQTNLNVDSDLGLLAFYRLILCVYFNANRPCLHNFSSPVELFDSIQADSVEEHHSEALDIVRKASWKGVYEDELMPSDKALQLHWLRTCWVSTVWGNVMLSKFMYPDITKYGFKVSQHEGEVLVDVEWDSAENVNKIKENVVYLTRGCACSKNKCKNRQCKCKKQNNFCGPGCRCKGCENVPGVQTVQNQTFQSEDDNDDDDEEEDEDDYDSADAYSDVVNDNDNYDEDGNDEGANYMTSTTHCDNSNYFTSNVISSDSEDSDEIES